MATVKKNAPRYRDSSHPRRQFPKTIPILPPHITKSASIRRRNSHGGNVIVRRAINCRNDRGDPTIDSTISQTIPNKRAPTVSGCLGQHLNSLFIPQNGLRKRITSQSATLYEAILLFIPRQDRWPFPTRLRQPFPCAVSGSAPPY